VPEVPDLEEGRGAIAIVARVVWCQLDGNIEVGNGRDNPDLLPDGYLTYAKDEPHGSGHRQAEVAVRWSSGIL